MSDARALVLGHGDFAVGIVSAVEQITGNGSMLIPLANAGLSTDSIEQLVREKLNDSGVRIVFTDLPAGSATMAVRRVQRSRPDLTLVAGANLAALLEFVQQVDLPTEASAIEAMEKGKAAMMAFRSGGSAGAR
jgi:PTS system N-acetylgalactosamine-specific IIA component